jgi:hypothetical protein
LTEVFPCWGGGGILKEEGEEDESWILHF